MIKYIVILIKDAGLILALQEEQYLVLMKKVKTMLKEH